MSFELNEKLRGLQPYDPIAGDYPIRLDANESFLPISQAERAAIAACAESVQFRRYPDPAAISLRAAAADFYGVPPALLTAWNGTDEALQVLSAAFLGKGDALLCLEPDFSMYGFYAYLSGADVIRLPKREDYAINADAVIATLRQRRPTALVFSNPCNPTSLVLSREAVRDIVHAANDAGTLVVLDEAYMDFSDQSLLAETAAHPNLVILRTCSKAPGLAGLRLGFSVANTEITRILQAAKSPYNVGVWTQTLGEALLRQADRLHAGTAALRRQTAALSVGLRALAARFPAQLQVIGDSANFVFATLPDAAAAFEALKATGIIVRRFGDGALRVTAGSRNENAEFLAKLGVFLERGSDYAAKALL
ncbi:MAG: histidinol-phosphate aminotransferase family protein [Oscillospiraceae bacterium]|jgi:histidinol-phosphate aminotransferase|nr:histidinol-phosphate aminotransferase family protein [Oscillospiraceae bacterium]